MTSPRYLVLALCVLIAVIAAAVWLRPPAANVDPVADPEVDGGEALDPQSAEQLVQQLNVGVAHLENGQLDDAIKDFTALEEVVPRELAAQRDLMVARLLQLTAMETTNPSRDAAHRQAAQTLSALESLDPDAVATHVLAGRLAALQGNTAAAMQELQRATALSPEDLPTWFEQFTLAQYTDDAALREQARAALTQAFDLSPTNLVVLLERLQAQVQAEDATIVETLAAGEPRWQQLAPGVKSRVRVDIRDLVSAAKDAAAAMDWTTVRRNILMIKNVVTPEEATRSDRRLVDRHALEFVLDELSEPVMELASQATTFGPPVVPTFSRQETDARFTGRGTVTAVVPLDFDLDTQVDIARLQDDQLEILRRDADSWASALSFTPDPPMQSLIAVDLDDDVVNTRAEDDEATPTGHPRCHRADLDLVLFGSDGVVVLENVVTDDGRELTPFELTEDLANLSAVQQVVPGDLDMDGDLDLITLTDAGLQLWGNQGDRRFSAEQLQIAALPDGAVFSAALPIDWDDDLDLDVVLADTQGQLGLLENLRHGEFQWRDLDVEVGPKVTSLHPLDRDGAWDLLLGGDGGLQRIRSSHPIDGRVTLEPPEQILETPIRTLDVVDINNDTALDVVALADNGVVILTGNADTSFTQTLEDVVGDADNPVESFAIADINNDGRLDVVAGTSNVMSLSDNTTANDAGWIDVSLLAEQIKGNDLSASGRVNHYGIGSVLELRLGTHRQRQIVRGPTVHFGLARATQADTVRVLWTNGVPENVIEPQTRTFICERQTLKGSCPYLYGWNGEEFAFITDLLWASPIGLVGSDGKLVPGRSWEYLRIAPQQLVARDGKYELRLTEELWEAAYFDSVQLTAVDHPQSVDVFTNEKVGPSALAEPKLHTVQKRRVPVSAVDQQQRDVLPLIRKEDERYTRLFDRKLRQGYTEPTTLELDFGDLSDIERATLFLAGWIYPTDTTINVALSQNSALNGPTPLSLAVPNADGEWQTVIPYTGFPGGKTKTIAIELSNVFLTDDHRIRLATSMELYWDAIWITVDDPAVELREQELTLLRAELRSRGVSAAIVHPQFGPERYDYENASPSHWRPMAGHFTRFGDVRSLIAEDDDQLVVMGSGDEIVLEFTAPPPPPEGWTRSFVIRNVGWDKDADLHTVYGQTVEPLPHVKMSAYPWPPDEASPEGERYQAYLRNYQTRQLTP